MAPNSKRERILVALQATLEEIGTFKQVRRTRPEFAEMDSIPSTLMPMLAMVAGLPDPQYKQSSRRSGSNDSDLINSALLIDVYCYARALTEPDTVISDYADDIWAKLHSIGTLGDLISELTVKPEVTVGVFRPFIMFKMSSTLSYFHTIGGI